MHGNEVLGFACIVKNRTVQNQYGLVDKLVVKAG